MPVPVDLSKLSGVVKNDVVKKAVYETLVTKVNNIDTTVFVLEIKYDTDRSDLEKKISGAEKKLLILGDFLKKTDINAKTIKSENKIASISGLVTNSALTAVGNKITDVSNSVNKQK